MDVVGGAASVTQLIAYSHVVVQRLVQLHKFAQEGSAFCRTQRSNIGFLLESIQRICTVEAPDTDSILPLLIATAGLATSLLILLKPKGSFYHRWLWISKGHEIESAFSALNDKTRLLQLHITEKTYSIVTHVQKDIKHMNQSHNNCPLPQMDLQPATSTLDTSKASKSSNDSSKAPKTGKITSDSAADSVDPRTNGQGRHVEIISNRNKVKDRSQQSVAVGWGKEAGSAKVIANANETDELSQQAVANAEVVPMDGVQEVLGAQDRSAKHPNARFA